MKTGILFDLDGTLLDTLDDLMGAVNAALTQFGCPTRSREEIRSFVGNGAYRLIASSLPGKNDDPDTEAVLAAFREHYKNHDRDATRPYPGITETLSSLDMPMGIVSNKPDAAVKRLCADFFPGIYARGEVEGVARKPAPDGLFAAMQDLGIDRCIYIGDSDVDIATAKNAGIPCLCVTWGFRTRQQLEEAGGANFCEEVSSLPNKIKELLYGK